MVESGFDSHGWFTTRDLWTFTGGQWFKASNYPKLHRSSWELREMTESLDSLRTVESLPFSFPKDESLPGNSTWNLQRNYVFMNMVHKNQPDVLFSEETSF